MKNKSNITQELLNALEHTERATPDAAFLSRMESMAVNYGGGKEIRISTRYILSIAASFILLAAANYLVITTSSNASQDITIVDDYQKILVPTKSLYYE